MVELGGHRFDLRVHVSSAGQRQATFTLAELPEETVSADTDTLGGDGYGLISRLENRVTNLDRVLATRTARLEVVDAEITNAQRTRTAPFPHQQALTEAHEHLAGIVGQLNAKTTPTQEPGGGQSDTPDPPDASPRPPALRGGAASPSDPSGRARAHPDRPAGKPARTLPPR
jgi:hypothetical protein